MGQLFSTELNPATAVGVHNGFVTKQYMHRRGQRTFCLSITRRDMHVTLALASSVSATCCHLHLLVL